MQTIYSLMIQAVAALVLVIIFSVRMSPNRSQMTSMAIAALLFTLFCPQVHLSLGGPDAGELASYVSAMSLIYMVSVTFCQKRKSHDQIMARFKKAHLELDEIRRLS